MILKKHKIKVRKKDDKKLSKEEYEEIKNEVSQKTANFNPASKQEECVEITEVEDDEDNVVVQMINEKRTALSQEKKDLASLETKIKKDCSEIEALEYIASGEPTMSIMDLLNMLHDFYEDIETYDDATQLLDAMEQKILISTIQSIKS